MGRWLPRALGAGALAGVIALLAMGAAGASPGHLLACPILAATGIPCPFCGMTRATLALGHGDLATALDLHPLAPLVLAGAITIFALAAAGRTAALSRGAPLILAVIAVIWAVRLAV